MVPGTPSPSELGRAERQATAHGNSDVPDIQPLRHRADGTVGCMGCSERKFQVGRVDKEGPLAEMPHHLPVTLSKVLPLSGPQAAHLPKERQSPQERVQPGGCQGAGRVDPRGAVGPKEVPLCHVDPELNMHGGCCLPPGGPICPLASPTAQVSWEREPISHCPPLLKHPPNPTCPQGLFQG